MGIAGEGLVVQCSKIVYRLCNDIVYTFVVE